MSQPMSAPSASAPSAAPSASADFAVSIDKVLGGRLRLAQPKGGYRFAIDPVLLAASVPAGAGERVLDLGCGIGTAALCLAKRVAGCSVLGLDLQADLVALAGRNAEENGLSDRVRFLSGDLMSPPAEMAPNSFDHVLCNPPYLRAGHATPSQNKIKVSSNIEGKAGLADWVAAAARFCRPGGGITFIHRADRLTELQALLTRRAGALLVLPLLPRRGAAPKRVIVQGVKGATDQARFLDPLILHEADGRFTESAQRLLLAAEGLDLRSRAG